MLDEAALKRVMATVLKAPPSAIGPDASQDTIPGWDSLRQLNLVLALEQEFGVEIPDEEAGEITSYPLIKLVLQELVGA